MVCMHCIYIYIVAWFLFFSQSKESLINKLQKNKNNKRSIWTHRSFTAWFHRKTFSSFTKNFYIFWKISACCCFKESRAQSSGGSQSLSRRPVPLPREAVSRPSLFWENSLNAFVSSRQARVFIIIHPTVEFTEFVFMTIEGYTIFNMEVQRMKCVHVISTLKWSGNSRCWPSWNHLKLSKTAKGKVYEMLWQTVL